MTQVELEIKLIEYKGGKITLTEAMTAVEAYSLGSNDGNANVMRSLPPEDEQNEGLCSICKQELEEDEGRWGICIDCFDGKI